MFNFSILQLNSPFDDSAFFVRDVYRKRAMLFDCGKLGGLTQADLLSIGDIFISHTHMDHFVGFDRIIRGALNSTETVRVFGPPGIIGNVDGKFRGYTWNLVDGYSFAVDVIELLPEGAGKRALFRASCGFTPEYSEFEANGSFDLGEGFTLKYEYFDHRTLSMGFRVEEPVQFSVDKERLKALGYQPGPWLKELKSAVRQGDIESFIVVDNGSGGDRLRADELARELITERRPEIITYITDCAPTEENIEKAVKFASGSTLLIIEAVFLDEDREHAEHKNHLTLGIAKKIFFDSGSEYVRFTHFASRYEHMKEQFMAELYKGMDGRVHTKTTR